MKEGKLVVEDRHAQVAGATLVIQPAADPKAMLGAIAEHKITMILAIPTLLRMLLDHPDAAQADLSSLRIVVYAAAPTAPGRASPPPPPQRHTLHMREDAPPPGPPRRLTGVPR